MELVVLAKIAGVLCLGAVSPGPSLAVVVRNTFLGGRARGVACSIGHGLGFGLYAFVVISLLTVLNFSNITRCSPSRADFFPVTASP